MGVKSKNMFIPKIDNFAFWLDSIIILFDSNLVSNATDRYSAIRHRCESSNYGFACYSCSTDSDVINALFHITNLCNNEIQSPLIVFEFHGNEKGIFIGDHFELGYKELSRGITLLNQKTINTTSCIFATCYAGQMAKTLTVEGLSEFTLDPDVRCPVQLLLAPQDEISEGDVLDYMLPFIEDIAAAEDISKSILALVKSGNGENVRLLSHTHIWAAIQHALIESIGKQRFSNQLLFDTEVFMLANKKMLLHGQPPNKFMLRDIEQSLLNIDTYKVIFKEYYHTFYFLDIHSDHTNKCDFFMDEERLKRFLATVRPRYSTRHSR